MFNIEKGVPIPRKNAYPSNIYSTMGRLEIGDSFFIPLGKYKERNLKHHIYERQKLDGRKYTIRKDSKSRKAGVRVWRVQ